MEEVNRLGLRVAGITTVVLLVLFGLYWGGRFLFKKGAEVQQVGEPVSLAERQQDSDGDGVVDLYETIYYNTDPNNPDTDGDGSGDFEEITSGRDPLVAGPKDISKPPTGSGVTKQDTFTRKYLASLPDDVPRENILDQVALESFIEANRGELLPTLPAGSVKTIAGTGKDVVSGYLDEISSSHNNSLTAVTSTDIDAAFRLRVNSGQADPLNDLVIALTNNVGVLEDVAAPAETMALHTKLLTASKALRDNARALRDVQQDFVGGLIAAKNIEDLGPVFQEVAQDVQTLETKYGLE